MAQGQRLGQYELIDLLGRGGMGDVWRARHTLLGRPAAVKRIQPGGGVDRDQLLQRFKREARATSALESPHTVDLYDFGVTDDGALYYVMELLHGVDLKQLVAHTGPVDAARVVHIGRAVCQSLNEAHQRGMLHRDIKPANIFLCRLGLEYDFVKVLDFGLVKFSAERPEEQITASQNVLGTPAFLAPEMARSPALADGRADLYSLGCVLHWLLTGRLLFEAETAVAMVVAHLSQPPPPIVSEMPIPKELSDVVLRCLAKDPNERFPSAAALLEALDAVPLERPWTQGLATSWWRAHLPEYAADLQQLPTSHAPAPSTPEQPSELSGSLPGVADTREQSAGRPLGTWLFAALVLALLGVPGLYGLSLLAIPSPVEEDQVTVAPGAEAALVAAPPETDAQPEVQPETNAEAEPERPIPAPAIPPDKPTHEVDPARAWGEPGAEPDLPEPPTLVPEDPPDAEVAVAEVDVNPDADADAGEPDEAPATEADEAPEPNVAPARRILAGVALGERLPAGRNGAYPRYTCIPSGTNRFSCRGAASWLTTNGTWALRVDTCEGRIVRQVRLTRNWTGEASADPHDEVVSSSNTARDSGVQEAAAVALLQGDGWRILNEESGDDGRKKGGAWAVTLLGAADASAVVRRQQEGEDHKIEVTANAPASSCE